MDACLRSCSGGQLLPGDCLGTGILAYVLVSVLNVFITPILLVYWSISIYVYPCLINLMGSCLCRIVFMIPGMKCCVLFTDTEFPANDANAGKTCKWVRLQDVKRPSATASGSHLDKLFNKVDPGDIAQGQLGDCWLLAAFATLAEKPEYIQKCFLTRSFNPRGKYTLRLYDTKAQPPLWRNITIDDWIPCGSDDTPLYSKPNSNDMWPLLIEKAFAKMRGGYSHLDGGWPMDAMKTMTGFKGETFTIDPQNAKLGMFHSLKEMHDKGCIMACASKGKDNTLTDGRSSVQGSIVGGHAYSILGMYEPTLTTEKVQLLKIRNPWGSFEWKGAWSDKSEMWNTHPGVAATLGKPKDTDDGIFYMPWNDFIQHYSAVDVLFPDTSLSDMHITIHEECGIVMGPIAGCLIGCTRFWCMCQGLYALCFAKSSNKAKQDFMGIAPGESAV